MAQPRYGLVPDAHVIFNPGHHSTCPARYGTRARCRCGFSPLEAKLTRWEGPAISAELARTNGKGWPKVNGEGHCRLCLRPARVRPLTRHHLVPQSWFRAVIARTYGLHGGHDPARRSNILIRLPGFVNADANIVPLCAPCHRDVERIKPVRRMLRRRLTQAEISFIVHLRGKEWLDHRYPLTRPRSAALQSPE